MSFRMSELGILPFSFMNRMIIICRSETTGSTNTSSINQFLQNVTTN